MIERLARRLKLDRGEMGRALALGSILAGVTVSYTITKTVRDALFLEQLPASTLPYVFLGVGVLTTLASGLFTRATSRRTQWEALATVALLAAISLAAFGQLFRLRAGWVPIAFYLWVNVYGLILVSQFWLFANSVSHPREARRTFGLVGAGGILGGLAGGLIAAPLARVWDLPSLLHVAAFLQAAVVLLVRFGSMRVGNVEEPESTPARTLDAAHHPYVRWLGLAALCSVVVTGVLDYQFKVQIQRRYPSGAELASFLGLYYTLTNLAALALQALGARWMVQRFGAAWAASLLPAGLGLSTALMLALPSFSSVAVSRLWDQVTRLSVNRSVSELFYFPLEPALRRRAKALIGAGLERLGDGFAGLLILGMGWAARPSSVSMVPSGLASNSIRTFAIVVTVLLVVWAVAWIRVSCGYVRELGVNLRRMNLDTRESRVSLREAGMLKEMERLLRSPYERVVIHGIDLLEENFPEELEGHLAALLDHVSPRVRSRALQRVRARSLDRFRGSVARLIHDADGEVQVEALSTHCALEGTDPFDAIHEYLTAEDPRVRAAAILCITELAPRESEARLRGVLERLMRDGTPAERVTAAEALGRRAPGEIHHLLTPLLTDSDLAVRRAALRSAGRAQLRAHVPVMIEALGQRPTEEAARSALATLGDRVVGTLGDYLCDASVPIEIRYAIPRALGEIHTQGSADALFRLRERGDFKLGYRVLKAANHIRSSAARVEFPRAAVTEDIEADVRGHLFALVHYRSCPVGRGPLSPERLLCVALNERMDQALNRIFRRLALLYPPQNILAAYRGVVSLVPRPRGHAIEYLENALSLEHRALVLPLVDDTGDEGKLRLAERRYGMRRGTLDDSLEAFLGSDDDWLRACALYVVGSRKERRLLPLVQSSLENSNPLVRETASWAALAIATV